MDNEPIVIDGSSDASPVTIPSPSLIDEQSDLVIDDVVADNEGKLVWEDEFNMVIPIPWSSRIEGRSNRALRYKGVVWTILVVLDIDNNKFGIFFGIDHPELMPLYSPFKFEYYFELLESDGNFVTEGMIKSKILLDWII